MAKEICERCEKVFEAGPYAFICPKCRKKAMQEAARKSAKARNLNKIGNLAHQRKQHEK